MNYLYWVGKEKKNQTVQGQDLKPWLLLQLCTQE